MSCITAEPSACGVHLRYTESGNDKENPLAIYEYPIVTVYCCQIPVAPTPLPALHVPFVALYTIGPNGSIGRVFNVLTVVAFVLLEVLIGTHLDPSALVNHNLYL
jgi:hypothetical protein